MRIDSTTKAGYFPGAEDMAVKVIAERTIDLGPACRVPLDEARKAWFVWEALL